MPPHLIFILFAFALGACIGSFLNVVVWRLPRVELPENVSVWRSIRLGLAALAYPPSHCPKCNTPLAWRDNIPVFGWLALRGKCRYCGVAISPRYPIVEAACGLLFVFYYVAFYIWQIGPCPPQPTIVAHDQFGDPIVGATVLLFQEHWPIYAADMMLIACLLAASLIDAELFIIPIEIPWLAAIVGVIAHAMIDHPIVPGALSVGPLGGAVAAGGLIGLIVSLALHNFGFIQRSFSKGEPMLEIDRAAMLDEIAAAKREGKTLEIDATQLPPEYSRREIRAEIGKEMLFLLPPLLGATAMIVLTQNAASWARWIANDHLSGLLGAILGALIGAFVVWMTRILATLAFGRVAMGLGDVHLMLGVGAVIGAGPVTIAFFLAPFCGIVFALYKWLAGKGRELPYGPFLAMGTACVLLFYCPIAAYLSPGMQGLLIIAQRTFRLGGNGG